MFNIYGFRGKRHCVVVMQLLNSAFHVGETSTPQHHADIICTDSQYFETVVHSDCVIVVLRPFDVLL